MRQEASHMSFSVSCWNIYGQICSHLWHSYRPFELLGFEIGLFASVSLISQHLSFSINIILSYGVIVTKVENMAELPPLMFSVVGVDKLRWCVTSWAPCINSHCPPCPTSKNQLNKRMLAGEEKSRWKMGFCEISSDVLVKVLLWSEQKVLW